MTGTGQMLQTIKALLLDFHESPLDPGSPRSLRVSPLPKKASVVIGVRRSGKSTYLFQIMQRLLDTGVPKANLLYLNFFDDRLHFLTADLLDLVPEAYFALHPEKKSTEVVHCFFDEIQAVSGWEPFLDRLMRTERCEVYVTGSSSRMLSKEIATQMRGRALSWEMFPFSFHEFLVRRGVDARAPLSTKKRLLVQQGLDEYWLSGGFPEVFGLERGLRIKIHQEYFHTILFRDLVERHDVSHPKAVTDLAHWLLNNAASLYTVNRLTGYLKSLGHKVPKASVSDYLAWFEDAYFLFTVRLFDPSLARANANPKKVYAIDHALVASVSSGILVSSGHLLENLVFLALRRQGAEVFYYKTTAGREVDFVVAPRRGARVLVQACESLADPRTKQREVSALAEAMRELQVPSGVIVTRNDEGTLDVEGGTIDVQPLWRFLLLPPAVVGEE